MVRTRLFVKGLGDFKFLKEYVDNLALIFLNKINKFIFIEPIFKKFNYFTFSYFIIEQAEEYGRSAVSKNGIVNVVIPSISEEFIRKFTAFLFDRNNAHLKNNTLILFKFDIFTSESWSHNDSFKIISLAQHHGLPTEALYGFCRYGSLLYFPVKHILKGYLHKRISLTLNYKFEVLPWR